MQRHKQVQNVEVPNLTELIISSNQKLANQNAFATPTTTLMDKQSANASLPLQYRVARITSHVFVKAINVVYVPIFIYRAFQKPKKCPPITDEILKIPAVELAKKISNNEISCENVISKYIARIKEVNPLLNAVIEDRFAEAIKEAKSVDALVNSQEFITNKEKYSKEYPLLGVPLTVKGSIAVKGLKYTSGMVTRKEVIAEKDADTVELARKAGAIPLLVSNVPELCMNWETSNKLIGTTTNPHDHTRTCGGSSGGEGSLLGAGASLIGIGSDIAGSLRLPAHFCGVYGHKPTPGAVSFEGHYPSCADVESWRSVFSLGPMARYADDLRILLGVIAKPEEKEKLGLNEEVIIRKIKVYYAEELENFLYKKPNENCSGAVSKVVEYLKGVCDATPRKANFHLLQYATDLASLHLLSVEHVDHIFDNDGNGVFAEMLRFATFQSKHSMMTILFGLLRKFSNTYTRPHKETLLQHLEVLRKEFGKTLGEDGVFILPCFPLEATKHMDSSRNVLCNGYMSIFNALGFPVTNCPVGRTNEGLPVGVQIVGLPYCDKLTLAVAKEIEKGLGGWVEPKEDS